MKRKSEKNPSIGNVSRINEPEKLTVGGINRIFVRALYEQGIRDDLPEGSNRHPFKGIHGLRKWFKTRAEQAMLRTNVEYIIGHSLGMSQSYYRPTEHELLTDYLKAVPYLSINDDNAIDIKNLKEEQQALVKRSEHKDKVIEEMQATIKSLQAGLKENTETLFNFIANTPNHLMKVEPLKEGDTTAGTAEVRIYNDEKDYQQAVKSIRKKGDWG